MRDMKHSIDKPVVPASDNNSSTAVIINQNSAHGSSNTPIVIASSVTRGAIAVTAQPVDDVGSTASGTYEENERYGVCRGCRRVFERSPEFHDGHVQYYRCQECNSRRLHDTIASSCAIS